jgi:protoporphyrinogen oxidase
MAAFGAAYRLSAERHRVTLYDRNSYFGGHTASFQHPEGFTFDDGPHVSFTSDSRIQQILEDSVDGHFETLQYHVNNYWQGYWLRHPVQCNLYGLPPELIVRIVDDFARTARAPDEARNYEEWLVAAFGRTFADLFPNAYAMKYHTTSAANLTVDWIGPRVYPPSLQEVLLGALSPATPNIHYVTAFRYPSRGGFVAYLRKMAAATSLKLSHDVCRIDTRAQQLWFRNGATARFDALVSSVPLPDLVPMIDGAPDEVRAAGEKLAHTSCVLVNIGVDRADLSSNNLTYFYDADIACSRVSFPHLLSAHNAPAGCGSVQAEIYFSPKYKPLRGRPQDSIESTIRDLTRCGILKETDRTLFSQATVCKFANVIYDSDRRAALEIVHGFLDDCGIRYCGRYGDWNHAWTDESFKSGESAAEKALSDCASRRAASMPLVR